MKILVISGFLGAGKTTFIKEMARRTKKDFAVMENELGALGVDGAVLAGNKKEGEKPLSVWELTEGCICCSTKTDFAASTLTIANTVDPEYLVVEPTGVGMLSRIIENIRAIEYEKISLLQPITILDGNMFERCMREFGEVCKDQILSANRIVISKMESKSRGELEELEEKLRRINPEAEILSSHYAKQPESWWDSLLLRPLDAPLRAAPASEEEIELESIGLTNVGLENETQLLLFLQGVVCGVFGDVCRAKGYLRAGRSYLRFDVADRRYAVTEMEGAEDAKGVFIGKDLQRGLFREVLQKELLR